MKAAETQRAKLIDLFVQAEVAAPSSLADKGGGNDNRNPAAAP
jgi:hypothetical protein